MLLWVECGWVVVGGGFEQAISRILYLCDLAATEGGIFFYCACKSGFCQVGLTLHRLLVRN